MRSSDHLSQNNSITREKQDERQAIATLGWEDLTKNFTPQSKLLRPSFKYRRLVRALILLLIILLIFAVVRLGSVLTATDDQLQVRLANQSTITVDLRQSSPISPYLYGANAFPEVNSSSVGEDHTGFMDYTSSITNGLKNADVNLLRFPGGTWGEQHLLSYDQLNQFSTLLSQVGAEGMIQARLSGPVGQAGPYLATLQNRAALAGNWVDYMNNPQSSFRSGPYAQAPFHPIKFWSVGNEPDRLINPDTNANFTVAEYVNAFIQFSTVMHQNNPTIQVFGPELSQFEGLGIGPTDANGQRWMEGFLQGVHDYEKAHPELKFHLLDGVSFHYYPFNATTKSPAALLSSSSEMDYLLSPLRQFIRQTFGRDIPVGITEINSSATDQVFPSGVSALWWADTLGALMNQQTEYVAFFGTEGINPPPYPLFTTNGEQETPMFRVMQLFSHLQHNLVPIGIQNSSVNMYATQDDGHNAVSFVFVNNSATTQLVQVSDQNQFFGFSNWHDQDISLNSYSITVVTLHRGGGAEAYSYNVPSIDDATVAPVSYTVCGHQTDPLSNNTPC